MTSILTQRFKMKDSDAYMFVEHFSDDDLFCDLVRICAPFHRRVYGDDFSYVADDNITETNVPLLTTDSGRNYFTYQNDMYFLNEFDHPTLPELINTLKNDKLNIVASDLRWALVYGGIHRPDAPITFLVFDRNRDPASDGRVTDESMVLCKCIDASRLLINSDRLDNSGWLTLQAIDGTFAKSFFFSDLAGDVNSGLVQIRIPDDTTWHFGAHADSYMYKNELRLFNAFYPSDKNPE